MGAGNEQLQETGGLCMTANKISADGEVTLQYDVQKWHDWRKLMGAQDVSIMDFYFGRAKSKDLPDMENEFLRDKENEFLLKEIFLDAIDIGAISFSAEVRPKDFSFKLKRNAYGVGFLTMEYAPKGVIPATGVTSFFDDYLASSRKIGAIYDVFRCFRYAMWDAIPS